MKEFISANGITMIEGLSFNWEKQSIYYNSIDPYVLSISVGFFNPISFIFNINEKYISISSDKESFKFEADDLVFAEMLVLAYIKKNHLEIAPLYKK